MHQQRQTIQSFLYGRDAGNVVGGKEVKYLNVDMETFKN